MKKEEKSLSDFGGGSKRIIKNCKLLKGKET